MSDPRVLDGWLPIRTYAEAGGLRVEWAHLGERRLMDPFFDETIERRLRHPFALLFRHQTSMAQLLERQVQRPGLAPAGFVFHMSRCGSTLISQMLAALPWSVVLSEPGPVDGVLRAHLELPGQEAEETRIAWLRAMVAALGQPRAGGERALFLKLDAWHVLHLPLIERAFPGVPWVFLYREPGEVMASHLGHRGAHMLPGVLEPGRVGLRAEQLPDMALEEYGARVLGRILEAGLSGVQGARSPARLVNYTELPAALPTLLQEHFGLRLGAEDLALLAAAGARSAKNPVMTFEDDRAEKARRLTPAAREAAERFIQPAYARLESLRQAAQPPR